VQAGVYGVWLLYYDFIQQTYAALWRGHAVAKEARGAVVSVRISDDEQARLRARAEERGLSVSELIRNAALAQVTIEDASPAVGTTQSGGEVGKGIFWDAPEGAEVSGSTLTY
jgi:hypothetical protein